jgi:hypothetical protein
LRFSSNWLLLSDRARFAELFNSFNVSSRIPNQRIQGSIPCAPTTHSLLNLYFRSPLKARNFAPDAANTRQPSVSVRWRERNLLFFHHLSPAGKIPFPGLNDYGRRKTRFAGRKDQIDFLRKLASFDKVGGREAGEQPAIFQFILAAAAFMMGSQRAISAFSSFAR